MGFSCSSCSPLICCHGQEFSIDSSSSGWGICRLNCKQWWECCDNFLHSKSPHAPSCSLGQHKELFLAGIFPLPLKWCRIRPGRKELLKLSTCLIALLDQCPAPLMFSVPFAGAVIACPRLQWLLSTKSPCPVILLLQSCSPRLWRSLESNRPGWRRNPSLGRVAVAAGGKAEKFVDQWCHPLRAELSWPWTGREHRNEAEWL